MNEYKLSKFLQIDIIYNTIKKYAVLEYEMC